VTTEERLANRHFLVVDDESFIRNLVARFLMRSGAGEVVEVPDGRQAMAAIASHDMVFDAVITDVRMQPVDGIELLRAIRTGAGGLKRNTAVLMLTAHAEAELVAEALALDVDAFVLKPVEREVLIERVLRALDRTAPIASIASYAAVTADGRPRPLSAVALAPAPPTKALNVTVEALLDVVAEPELEPEPSPTPAVHMVPLADVRPNSILARDIHLASTSQLLVAAPVIMTRALIDRLLDLRNIHDGHAHVFVFDPPS
jgi:CheY-like chemotaxis protein